MFAKSSKALVIERINLDNGTAYTEEMLNFGPVIVLPEGHPSLREVSVLLTASPLAKLKGQRMTYYNRYNLSEEFGSVPTLVGENILTEQDAIDHFNKEWDTRLTTEDVYVVEFENGDLTEQPTSLTFIAKPNSYAYVGEVSYGLFEQLVNLADVLQVTVLDGLHWPEPLVELADVITTTVLNGLIWPLRDGLRYLSDVIVNRVLGGLDYYQSDP